MNQLQRKITLYGLTMIAVGSCIGAGIFKTPSDVVAALPHAGWVLVVWAIGGLIALTGALTFAELGGMFPKAGGIYVYLREAYGELSGFLYGWVTLLVVNTGSLAALGIALAEYLTFFVPLNDTGKILVAIATIAGLTSINIRGVDTSQKVINLFTGLKLVAMAAVVVVALTFFSETAPDNPWVLTELRPDNLAKALLLALVGVLWSFGGWHHATYLAGETIQPQRNVPRAMILGAVIVTITYILVNIGYLLLLPLEEIAASPRVAGDALEAAFAGGGKAVAVAIGISIFGTIAIYTMSAPRIYFAMARDGIFFKSLAKLHPRFNTPANAMAAQAAWAILLLLFWGTFDKLITYVTFIDYAFMALAGAAVFYFRIKAPDLERPYKTWGYPFVPLIFVGISTAFVINTLYVRPEEAVAGLFVLGVGVALYYFFKRQA